MASDTEIENSPKVSIVCRNQNIEKEWNTIPDKYKSKAFAFLSLTRAMIKIIPRNADKAPSIKDSEFMQEILNNKPLKLPKILFFVKNNFFKFIRYIRPHEVIKNSRS